jgi:pimeloyl-ACP methyl ester carboxylesterase
LAQSLGTGKEQIFRRVVGFDQTELLAQNRYPTVLLWGERDASAPVHLATEMHQKLPQSELKILSGLGHNIHLENPNLFYGTLKQILDNTF